MYPVDIKRRKKYRKIALNVALTGLIFNKIPSEMKNDKKFIDGSALKALNKCRNPTHDPKGPYCYAYTPWESETIKKRHCKIRKCRSIGNRTIFYFITLQTYKNLSFFDCENFQKNPEIFAK